MSGAITPSPLSTQYPHISHYVSSLLQLAAQENANSPAQPSKEPAQSTSSASVFSEGKRQHPLSVSSASSDVHDDEDDDRDEKNETQSRKSSFLSSSSSPTPIGSESEHGSSPRNYSLKLEIPGQSPRPLPGGSGSSMDREELVRKVVDLLGKEKEEEVKVVLKERLGALGNDEAYIDQVCLELMHKHKDDLESIPYTPFSVTPIRAKASPIPAHAQPFRPFTPSRVPSFRARTPLGRPQSPAAAGIIGSGSPKLTRTISQTSISASSVLGAAGFGVPGVSPRGSPATSPKLANRQLNFSSGVSNTGPFSPGGGPFGAPGSGTVTPTGKMGMQLPMPSNVIGTGMDPWASAFSKIASPLATPPVMSRSSSMTGFTIGQNTEDDGGYPFPIGQMQAQPVPAPASSTGESLLDDQEGVDDIFSTSAMNRHKHMLPDEDDDEFSPFSNPQGNSNADSPAKKLLATAKAFDPTKLNVPSAFGPQGGSNTLGGSFFGGGGMDIAQGDYNDEYSNMTSGMLTPGYTPMGQSNGPGPEDPNYLGEGMTPLDVLQSVFTSLPTGDLEEALHKTGYNFEEAMALLISQNGGTRSGNSGAVTPHEGMMGGNGMLGAPQANRPNVFAPGGPASRNRDMPPGGYYQNGGRGGFGMGGPGNASPRFGMGPSGTRTPGGLKMCRYYLAGECRRSDCRFSHDVDRALCRFWLRGQCAKGDQCEFIHAMPSVDPNMLTNAMSRIELSHDGTSRPRSRPDEFPDLHTGINQRGAVFDPSRNRFANAVKRPNQGPGPIFNHINARNAPVIPPSHRPFSSGSGFRRNAGPGPTGPPMPTPSPRIKLRPPTLLPTLPTGAALNDMYMEARQTAIKLGQSRNACLARAAEAWRRGDGATAKRFSREANVLNERMTVETADAAANLVRQRRAQAQDAIRSRGEWSNDADDRKVKGKDCAGGLGVLMGVAGTNALGAGSEGLSSAERVEALCDLHLLHAHEAQDVLEDFLMALERENFRGLAYVVVGEERHVGTQDAGRGASRFRLASGVKLHLQRYGYPWSESAGCICIDPLTHS